MAGRRRRKGSSTPSTKAIWQSLAVVLALLVLVLFIKRNVGTSAAQFFEALVGPQHQSPIGSRISRKERGLLDRVAHGDREALAILRTSGIPLGESRRVPQLALTSKDPEGASFLAIQALRLRGYQATKGDLERLIQDGEKTDRDGELLILFGLAGISSPLALTRARALVEAYSGPDRAMVLRAQALHESLNETTPLSPKNNDAGDSSHDG